ncbi:2''-aminoglycoside nucleotidyltransferase [Micromonospora coriariae]|uniref:2''-aminoglycoside nucleotidyltransferase n=1 Tax=Micromonospora coriariae TaxID=285665 RepID=A0A1C4WES9_9ACTN|nr:aminoglycoside adenylyltransferase [Micromonospora coriariae]SCE94756.1 2''-aminoglycoside nucleotidyltransferase [Micromonospora coriariae]
MDELARRQLASIAEVIAVTGSAAIPVWLRGGWAMDFHLGSVTRPHVDVDWYCWRGDAERLATLLLARDWRPDPRMPVEQQLDLYAGDVEVSFAYLGRDRAGRPTVGAGSWAGTPLPAGMLDAPPGRIGALTVPTISVAAQIEFKQMYPIWMPERQRRPKDADDLARLRATVPPPPEG